jgi:hypothetical protein
MIALLDLEMSLRADVEKDANPITNRNTGGLNTNTSDKKA